MAQNRKRAQKKASVLGKCGLHFERHSTKNSSNMRLPISMVILVIIILSNHSLKCFKKFSKLPDDEWFSMSRFDLTISMSDRSTMS